MAQPHLQPNQLGNVAPLDAAAVAQTPSFALVKGQQLEVMRLVLPAGKACKAACALKPMAAGTTCRRATSSICPPDCPTRCKRWKMPRCW